MFNRKLIKNKVYALLIIGVGVLSALPAIDGKHDITVLILCSIIGISIFCSHRRITK